MFLEQRPGVGGNQLLEPFGRRLTGLAHGVGRPALGQDSRGPRQRHRGQRLADQVVDPVQQTLTGQSALRGNPGALQRLGDQWAARALQQRAVKVEERGTVCHPQTVLVERSRPAAVSAE